MTEKCLFAQLRNKGITCGVSNPLECSKLKKQQGYTSCIYLKKNGQK